MSNSVSTVDHSATAGGQQESSSGGGTAEPSPQDGWRTGGLPALRAELDRIDDAVHDLLMQRAEVVEQVARSGKPAAFRPGREAAIIRRLLGRHHGRLPPAALVRIWRELLAGTTAMQGRFAMAVYDSEPGVPMTQLARAHFGALTPICACRSADQALTDVAQGGASVAVLAFPSETEAWWISLPQYRPRLHIIGRLPFWQPRSQEVPATRALVVAATPADPSGQDHTFLRLECDPDSARTRLLDTLTAADLRPVTLAMARARGSADTSVLAEVSGFVSDDDARLRHLGPVLRHPTVLGHSAVPIAEGA